MQMYVMICYTQSILFGHDGPKESALSLISMCLHTSAALAARGGLVQQTVNRWFADVTRGPRSIQQTVQRICMSMT